MKYNFCPFDQKLCYNKAADTLTDNSRKTAATATKFGVNDVCAWKIKTTSDFYFNKKIYIKINYASYVNCYLAYGDSLTSATNFKTCSAGNTFEIEANQHIFIVV